MGASSASASVDGSRAAHAAVGRVGHRCDAGISGSERTSSGTLSRATVRGSSSSEGSAARARGERGVSAGVAARSSAARADVPGTSAVASRLSLGGSSGTPVSAGKPATASAESPAVSRGERRESSSASVSYRGTEGTVPSGPPVSARTSGGSAVPYHDADCRSRGDGDVISVYESAPASSSGAGSRVAAAPAAPAHADEAHARHPGRNGPRVRSRYHVDLFARGRQYTGRSARIPNVSRRTGKFARVGSGRRGIRCGKSRTRGRGIKPVGQNVSKIRGICRESRTRPAHSCHSARKNGRIHYRVGRYGRSGVVHQSHSRSGAVLEGATDNRGFFRRRGNARDLE